MLAIIEFMKHWCHYFEDAKYSIQIYSDHKNLEIFMIIKILNHRQIHWAEFLTNYDFVLIYISDKKNSINDLSCHLDYMENVEIPIDILILKSALWMLQPHELLSQVTNDENDSHSSFSLNQLFISSSLKTHWNHIEIYINIILDFFLYSCFIIILKADFLIK